MKRKRLLAGNWKMNLTGKEAAALASQIATGAANLQRTEVWVAPTFTSLAPVAQALQHSQVSWGAQNAHWEPCGAFTGETSVPMLKELGCSFSLAGHSERRHIFGETDELVAQRVFGILKGGLTVVLCVGETLKERESGQTNAVLERQLRAVLDKIEPEQVKQVIIAYEPVWAIGTGKVATTKEIEAAHACIHSFWNSKLPDTCPPILYGGSVAPDNFAEIVQVPLVGGALVGGASLTFEKFKKLIAISEEVTVLVRN
ncbi:MAG: triose-phosphate isomerase [Deltaproteobacteria bacterium]|nr:triose-phosphate isomerase [Deltaproteobacteria bacterium]